MAEPSNPFGAVDSGLPGLLVLRPRLFQDARGSFVKTFHTSFFNELGIDFIPREEFYSVSARNVVRGLHFQVPPAAHAKLVYCPRGRVLDVVVDLRRQSGGFGQTFARELSGENGEILFIPPGFAHGFATLEADSMVVYKTDVVHTPDREGGIAWDSIDFKWPVDSPILSDRDRRWPRLADFISPFEGGI